jgi:calcium-dependent protein kinase
LAYIHSQGICHRDIKPENILYDPVEKIVKIIDFGISRKVLNRGRKTDMLTITGTLFYRAPEMFQGGGYDEMVDLWALGATIYRLMVGKTPFESPYHSETISNILKGEFSFPPEVEQKYSKSARNLVLRLLKRREERLSAKEALLDIWLIDLYQSAD